MPVEIRILALGALLLFVHIFVATRFKTAQYGRKWNIGARDETLPPAEAMTGRTMRAQANFAETFPIAIIALLGVVISGRTSEWTALGGWIWLGARLVYLPLYAMGVPVIRTVVWTIGMVGLAMVLWPLLTGW
ncbi:MAG TPA: MAPEG family protein [Sphingomicrobium sp.]|nr:MAPEG family protein [Sphingomicrobium sp.]